MVCGGIALTGVGRDCPVLMERTAPDSEVEDLHDDERSDNVPDEDFDANVLPSELREAEVEDEKAKFGSPYL